MLRHVNVKQFIAMATMLNNIDQIAIEWNVLTPLEIQIFADDIVKGEFQVKMQYLVIFVFQIKLSYHFVKSKAFFENCKTQFF